MKKNKNIIVAVAQLAPVFLNSEATIKKACDAIIEASKKKAKLIVFPEAFVSGYPYWALMLAPTEINDLNQRLFQEAIEIPSPMTEKLCSVAKKTNCGVVIGVNEREGSTLYNTLLFIDEKGNITGKHRKLIPTSHERMIWGRGDGSDLQVFDTSLGKIGGLICFEHANCLFKYALQGQGEEIHIAVWPGGLSSISHKIDAAIRSYAFESSCFVLNATSILTNEVYDALGNTKIEKLGIGGGYSAIVGPGGKYLAGPEQDKETILFATLNFDDIVKSKMIVDTAGHYTRPDVVQLKINTDTDKKESIYKENEG